MRQSVAAIFQSTEHLMFIRFNVQSSKHNYEVFSITGSPAGLSRVNGVRLSSAKT